MAGGPNPAIANAAGCVPALANEPLVLFISVVSVQFDPFQLSLIAK